MTFGRSLELFFIDGRPDGMLTARVFNWTGQILRVPRIQLKDALKRPEAGYNGVYLLLGEKDGAAVAYIGEGEEIGARIRDHDGKKDWWTTAVLVTTAADELNKAHVKYLESRLVEEALKARTVSLENGNTPPRSSLSEAGVANMEEFLDTLFIALPAIGVEVFVNKSRPDLAVKRQVASNEPTFFLSAKKSGINAQAVLQDGEFIVQKGSLAQPSWVGTGSLNSGYHALHRKLSEVGILIQNGPLCTFAENYAFSSSSAAAAVILGRAANGRTEWTLADGRTYKAWEEAELMSSDP
jgi:Domain of unknown function (DUF4357)